MALSLSSTTPPPEHRCSTAEPAAMPPVLPCEPLTVPFERGERGGRGREELATVCLVGLESLLSVESILQRVGLVW